MAKPQTSAGSIGLEKLQTVDELRYFLSEWAKTGVPFVIEEFVAGDEFVAVMILNSKREITNLKIYKYMDPLCDFVTECKPIWRYEVNPTLKLGSRCKQLVVSVLEAFGDPPAGMFTVQFFIQAGTGVLIFNEVAARIPGGHYGTVMARNYGINVEAMHYAASLSQTDSILASSAAAEHVYHAYVRYPTQPGTFVKMVELPQLTSEVDAYPLVKAGQKMIKPVELCRESEILDVCLYNKNSEELERDVNLLHGKELAVVASD